MRSWPTFCLLVFAACAGGGEGPTTNGFAGPSTPGGPPDESDVSGEVVTDTASDPTDSTGAPPDGTTAPEASTGPSVPNPDGLPSGDGCTDDAECMTENCYVNPLPGVAAPPGVCSQCDADLDCVDAGLGTACTLDPLTGEGRCSYGALGSFCEAQSACRSDLFCATLVPGAETSLPNVCSACREDSDCNTLRCVPDVDLAKGTALKLCKNAGTISDGDLCPLNSGDNMCVSGRCAPLDLGGGDLVGVCGPCNAMGGCAMGQTCQPPSFADAFIPAKCI